MQQQPVTSSASGYKASRDGPGTPHSSTHTPPPADGQPSAGDDSDLILEDDSLDELSDLALLGGEVPAELKDFALDDGDDFAFAGDESFTDTTDERLPVIAVIGRPNVGKSSLVNRIVGSRVAVVQDIPGVTRDRVRYKAQWAGRDFFVLDTGGWELNVKGIDHLVADQAQRSIARADIVLLIVDAVVGITDADEQLAKIVRRSGKPCLLVANKVDSASQEPEVWALWALGLDTPYPVSALHGRGMGDMLDAAMRILPEESEVEEYDLADEPARVALVGRPNVGKSSLLNALVGEDRVVVDSVAGTTRDPVDELVELEHTDWVFVDTAGIRRRMHKSRGADFYASIRTNKAIADADVVMVLLDATETISEGDIRIINTVLDEGKALVLVNNKWDEVDELRQRELLRETELDLRHVTWAPHINISAKTTWHTNRIEKALVTAFNGWTTRVPTGELNAFMGQLQSAQPHPVRGGKQPRILFATQARTAPPTIVLFTTGFIDATYRRFIERKLREQFGFEGAPMRMNMRIRERRGRSGGRGKRGSRGGSQRR